MMQQTVKQARVSLGACYAAIIQDDGAMLHKIARHLHSGHNLVIDGGYIIH
jgi:hypothetical protein